MFSPLFRAANKRWPLYSETLLGLGLNSKKWHSDMALKQRHKWDELAANDVKLVQDCDSDEEYHKYNSKLLTVMWPPLQRAKWQLLKIRQGTYVYVTPLPSPKRASTVSALSEKMLPSVRLDDKTDLKNASDSHSETENLLST